MRLIDADVIISELTDMRTDLKTDCSAATDSLFGKGVIKGLDMAIKKMQAEPVIEAEPASEQNIWEREKPTNKIMEYDEVYGHCPNCGCVVTDLNDIYVGLEPEEIRELATAKKEGRLVVLPCKVGDTVKRNRRKR